MSGMYGADVAQLRAAANQFARMAEQLDLNRMTVGNAIQISAWVGPFATSFRYQWDSVYSQQVHSAAALLKTGADRLRANADAQERASAVDGFGTGLGAGIGIAIGAGVGGGGGLLATIGAVWGGGKLVSGAYGLLTAPASAARVVTGLGFLAKNVRGTTSLKSMTMALEFSKGYKAVDKAAEIAGGGKVFGKVMGVAGVAFDAVDMVSAAREGHVGDAIYSGTKVALGIASMVPGPVGLVATGVSVGIALYENRAAIASAAQATAKVVAKTATEVAHTVSKVADAAGKAAKGFVDGVAKAAKSLWPF